MGGEFAREFPKIAGRLGLEGFECADPYVERLLEGFSFLAGRVQLKMDAEFPRFTKHLLEIVYPHYLAPTPSMLVARFQPDSTEGALEQGFVIPRDSQLRSQLGKGDQTPCEYRTAHDVTLWPLELTEAQYFAGKEPVAQLELPGSGARFAPASRLRFRTAPGLAFSKLAIDRLPLYLQGREAIADCPTVRTMLANAVMVVVRPGQRPAPWYETVAKSRIRRLGFEDDQALLPCTPPSFQGYRLLHEYFSFPQRYLFVELGGLGPAVRRCTDCELEVLILLNRADPALENVVAAENFALFCAPAVNLFPKRADRIHLSDQVAEHHLVPDRTRPMDFEVYQVTGVTGIGPEGEEQDFSAVLCHRYDRIAPAPARLLHRASAARDCYPGSNGAMGRARVMWAAKSFCRWSMPTKRRIAATCGNWRSPPGAPTATCRCTCRSAWATPTSRWPPGRRSAPCAVWPDPPGHGLPTLTATPLGG